MVSGMFEHEKHVLSIIQEYLNKNRVFDIDKVLPIILDRLAKAGININKDGVRKILVSLIEKGLITEGSSLSKNMILLNQKRRKVFSVVSNNPGTHFNKLVRETSFNSSVVSWHLNMLLKFNFIKKDTFKTREIYYPAEMTFESAQKICVSTKEKCQKILFFLKNNDIGLTKTQISEALQMHPNTITKYLEELEEFFFISKDQIGNRELYFINDF